MIDSRKIVGMGEIFLLVMMSFAFSFFMQENFVSGQEGGGSPLGQNDLIGASQNLPSSPNPLLESSCIGRSCVTNTQLPSEVAAKDRIIGPIDGGGSGVGGGGITDYAGFAGQAGTKTVTITHGSQSLTGTINAEGTLLTDANGVSHVIDPSKVSSFKVAGETGGATGLSGILSGTSFGTGGAAGVFSGLLSGALWEVAVYGGLRLIGSLFGLSDSQTSALAFAGGLGTFAGTTAYFLTGPSGVFSGAPFGLTPGMFGFLTGLGVAVTVFVLTYKKEKTEVVQFICEPWQPPVGGNNCELCNEDPLIPCSEYRCKSLGQACQILNKGEEDELCAWVNKDDVDAPIIEPWDEALKPAELIYTRDGLGFKLTQEGGAGGCIPAFTRLEFGVKTNEPSQCRIDLNLTNNYNEMIYLFGGSPKFAYEHAQTNFRVPNPFAPEEQGDAPTIANNGVYTLYVRCIDANGNGADNAAVPFRFCVQPGPDTEQPIIEGFSIQDGSPVSYEADSVGIQVYTNEPADCRWSPMDQSYETMENEMDCPDTQAEITPALNFECRGTLTGIQDRQNNDFYFRCKDRPLAPENERNRMEVSEKLTLRGTEPLTIESIGPSGTIRGATSIVPVNLTVVTAHGENEGAATCYYEFSEDGQFNIDMLGGGTFSHYQPIPLPQGDYNVFFKCRDKGGNAAFGNTSFSVVVDTVAPLISRVYRDSSQIKIITNEDAKCVYSASSCDYEFASGLPITYENSGGEVKRNVHLLEWNKETSYYVKCEDYQGKRVAPDKCSIVIQGAEF